MTRDEFGKMLEANKIVFVGDAAWRVAQLVAAAEREGIAKLFDGKVWSYDYREIAAAIRARGEE